MKIAKENISKLPEKCFGRLLEDNSVIEIRVGEIGYYPLNKGHVEDGMKLYGCKTTEDFVNTLNKESGITIAQRMAMEWGSQFGWEHGLSNPDRYDEEGNIIKEKAVVA